jgi:hydroxypyruvate isomerase
VNSPRVKLLYDIYHIQMMKGDLVRTIQQNVERLGHFHTGEVPGGTNWTVRKKCSGRSYARNRRG